MSCNCPQIVLDTVAANVGVTLARINQMKYLTTMFDRLFVQVLVSITDDLDAWIGRIPIPPTFDLSEIIAFLTCPMTPLAVSIDPSILATQDPRLTYMLITKELKATVRNVIGAYEADTARLQSAVLVQLIQKYVREIQRTLGDPYQFAIDYPLTLGYVTFVEETCPEIYANPLYPYQAFVEAISDWSFDGVLPSGISPSVQGVVDKVAEAETRIQAWRTLLTIQV
jgi:hypothetical protein